MERDRSRGGRGRSGRGSVLIEANTVQSQPLLSRHAWFSKWAVASAIIGVGTGAVTGVTAAFSSSGLDQLAPFVSVLGWVLPVSALAMVIVAHLVIKDDGWKPGAILFGVLLVEAGLYAWYVDALLEGVFTAWDWLAERAPAIAYLAYFLVPTLPVILVLVGMVLLVRRWRSSGPPTRVAIGIGLVAFGVIMASQIYLWDLSNLAAEPARWGRFGEDMYNVSGPNGLGIATLAAIVNPCLAGVFGAAGLVGWERIATVDQTLSDRC